jgi:hypothetical protein
MSRRIVNITLDNLGDLPPKCRKCVFWELGPVSRARAEESGDPELEKESWVSSVLLEWGSCGKIAYVDGVPAGYMLFAPPQYVPRSIAFPTSPVSADAVLFMTAHLLSEFAGGGIGRMLVQAMAKDLTRRGVRAIEAFGDRRWESPACMLPVDYLLAVGFKTVRPHHHYPRLRMELRTVLTWREDVEVALERLLGSMTPSTPQGALRPVLPVLRVTLRGRELIRPTEIRPGQPDQAAPNQAGPDRMYQGQMYSASSRSRADFGLAPTICLTTCPPENTFMVGMAMMP